MVKTAVILAAGRGTRLKELGKEIPKGFLQIGEKPIIVESLEKLSAVGIEQVVIVTGHCAEKYEELARSRNTEAEIRGQIEIRNPSETMPLCSARPSLPRIVTVHNDRYADSGSLYSLYLAGRVLEENSHGFLLLESDLVYESRALRVLQEDPRPDLILVSGITNSGDEVWVQTESGYLRALSKERSKLEPVETQARPGLGESGKTKYEETKDEPGGKVKNGPGYTAGSSTEILGELVGISKISMRLYAQLSRVAEGLFQKSLHVEYESGLMETAKQHPIPCLLVPDLLWAEIDDVNHLERAKGLYGRLS